MKRKLIYIALERYLNYFNKKYSAHQQHALEKEVMQDQFDSEAFDGLAAMDSKQLAVDINELLGKTSRKHKRIIPININKSFAAAAILILLVGTVALFYILKENTNQLNNLATTTPIKKYTKPNDSIANTIAQPSTEGVIRDDNSLPATKPSKPQTLNNAGSDNNVSMNQNGLGGQSSVQFEVLSDMQYPQAEEADKATAAPAPITRELKEEIADDMIYPMEEKEIAVTGYTIQKKSSKQSNNVAKAKAAAPSTSRSLEAAAGADEAPASEPYKNYTSQQTLQLEKFVQANFKCDTLNLSCNGQTFEFIFSVNSTGEFTLDTLLKTPGYAYTHELKRILKMYTGYKKDNIRYKVFITLPVK